MEYIDVTPEVGKEGSKTSGIGCAFFVSLPWFSSYIRAGFLIDNRQISSCTLSDGKHYHSLSTGRGCWIFSFLLLSGGGIQSTAVPER